MDLYKFVAAGLLIFAWQWRRPLSSPTRPSDIFFIAFFVLVLPSYVLGIEVWRSRIPLEFSAQAIASADLGFAIMLMLSTAALLARALLPARTAVPSIWLDRRTLQRIAVGAALVGLAMGVLLLAFSEFRSFRIQSMRFLTGDLSGTDYRYQRDVVFSNTALLDSVLGRLRYSVLPVVFALGIAALLLARRHGLALIFALTFFLLLPHSLSKLPIVMFGGYAVLAAVIGWRKNAPRLVDALLVSTLCLAAVVCLLAFLYTRQFHHIYGSMSWSVFQLAIDRVWGETFSVAVRYFEVYPNRLPFTGTDSIGLITKLLGGVPRNPDLEVPLIMLGPNSGSNPGIFFLSGYAAFGQIGVVFYVLIALGLFWALDLLYSQLRTTVVRIAYFAVVGMNLLFLLQVALPTALLTYGLVIAPAMLFCIDRLITHRTGSLAGQ